MAKNDANHRVETRHGIGCCCRDAPWHVSTATTTISPQKNRKPQWDSRPLNAHAARYADAMHCVPTVLFS